MTNPGFWGVVSTARHPHAADAPPEKEFRVVWNSEIEHMRLRVAATRPGWAISWHELEKRRGEPSALVFGSPFIASDPDYGETTRIDRINQGEAPDVVAGLYRQRGTAAFALLDGNFSLVLSDPGAGAIFLVADKFGCNDVYYREIGGSLLFSSDCGSLLEADMAWDPVAVSFFLGQLGFIPGRHTLSTSVKSVGRARFLRVGQNGDGLRVESASYWRANATWDIPSAEAASAKFLPLLGSATGVRTAKNSTLLLSGGTDSSLLLHVEKLLNGADLLTMTGAVKGWGDGEEDISKAASLAAALKVEHTSVVIEPADELIPEEWAQCCSSWMTGTRVTLPLFVRVGEYLRDRFGEGYTVLSGQIADTLSDNNYTWPSHGYTLRRTLFSSWFLSVLPSLRLVAPRKDRFVGRKLISLAGSVRGPRFAGMLESVFDGIADTGRFYDGRLFGHGEMPGRSAAYFPAQTKSGFEAVSNWYSKNFVT
ncbi:MAG: asparagine synthase-related protein, partial [Bryobacteraceae bacterium]